MQTKDKIKNMLNSIIDLENATRDYSDKDERIKSTKLINNVLSAFKVLDTKFDDDNVDSFTGLLGRLADETNKEIGFNLLRNGDDFLELLVCEEFPSDRKEYLTNDKGEILKREKAILDYAREHYEPKPEQTKLINDYVDKMPEKKVKEPFEIPESLESIEQQNHIEADWDLYDQLSKTDTKTKYIKRSY